MEDMCHEASYPPMLSSRSFPNKQLIFTVHPFCMGFFFFAQFCGWFFGFLFFNLVFFRALLILPLSGGLARDRASISAGSTHVVGRVYKLLGAEVQPFHQSG